MESFESRARILDAEFGLSFPTLSILHLIDLIRDHEARASTLVEKREVKDNEYAFELLKSNGIVSKEDYDAAPPSEHGFTRNVQVQHKPSISYLTIMILSRSMSATEVKFSDCHACSMDSQGLKHYRIEDYRVCRLKKSPFAESAHEDKQPMIPLAVNQIAGRGPLYGWFALDDSFYSARHGIYRASSARVASRRWRCSAAYACPAPVRVRDERPDEEEPCDQCLPLPEQLGRLPSCPRAWCHGGQNYHGSHRAFGSQELGLASPISPRPSLAHTR